MEQIFSFPRKLYKNAQITTICTCATKFFSYSKESKLTGIAFIDSTKLQVCHNLRLPRHQLMVLLNEDTEVWDGFMDLNYIIINDELAQKDINFIAGSRKSMKSKTMKLWGKLMLRKRFIIETVFD